ncbi:hypothetical protein [Nocardioides rubriscoriae]|uniref:hypothetical protein n=1 Tax=Nocardioides rubriscoriae TaxID=642762 RepID=UPI0011E07045|nr:hypothetical protein [Nocardioides rubriscoriae]
MDGDNSDERFPPTSGRVLGTCGVVIGLVAAVTAITEGGSWAVVALGVLFAAVSWVSLLRPRVAIEDDTLVLRNMVDTVRIPLVAVEDVVVRQVLAVRVGEKRYTSPAVGRPRRQMKKDDLVGDADSAASLSDKAFALFVEQRIRERASLLRAQAQRREEPTDPGAGGPPVERVPAVAEIAVLAASTVALVVAILV